MDLVIAHLTRIENKVDGLDGRLDRVEKVQIKQEANLAEHMKRSDLLERNHEVLEKSLRPVTNAYTVAWGICKVILGIGVVAGILAGLTQFFAWITA